MLTKSVLLNRSTSLSDAERNRLEAAIASVRAFRAGDTAVRQDTPIQVSLLLVEGFMTRYVDARDGKRHLVAVHVPGDFVDLHAFTLKQLDHDVGALTDVSVAVFTHEALEEILIDDAALARRLWLSRCSMPRSIDSGSTDFPASRRCSGWLTFCARPMPGSLRSVGLAAMSSHCP